MGNLAKSTEQHKRDGTYHAVKHGSRLDSDWTNNVEAKRPRGIKGEALAMWRQLERSLAPGVLQQSDEKAIEAICHWWARWKECVADEDWAGAEKAWPHVLNLMRDFGLTPQSRYKIKHANLPTTPKKAVVKMFDGA